MQDTRTSTEKQEATRAVQEAAERFAEMGVLTYGWSSHIDGQAVSEMVLGKVTGYAMDSQRRDCFLIQTTHTRNLGVGPQTTRCVPAEHMTTPVKGGRLG